MQGTYIYNNKADACNIGMVKDFKLNSYNVHKSWYIYTASYSSRRPREIYKVTIIFIFILENFTDTYAFDKLPFRWKNPSLTTETAVMYLVFEAKQINLRTKCNANRRK